MPDNKQITTQQDRIHVDSNDPSEIEYLHQKFPDLSHIEICQAIRKAGPFRKDIVKYLRARSNS